MAAFISTFHNVENNFNQVDIKFTEEPPTNISAHIASNVTTDSTKEVIIDTVAVFGAMLFAALAIIVISIYVSKVRRRQNQQLETAQQEQQPAADPSKEIDVSFAEHKPSLFRKTLRSVFLRLRGQQHKDVCVISPQLRAQLKEIYVY